MSSRASKYSEVSETLSLAIELSTGAVAGICERALERSPACSRRAITPAVASRSCATAFSCATEACSSRSADSATTRMRWRQFWRRMAAQKGETSTAWGPSPNLSSTDRCGISRVIFLLNNKCKPPAVDAWALQAASRRSLAGPTSSSSAMTRCAIPTVKSTANGASEAAGISMTSAVRSSTASGTSSTSWKGHT